MTPKKFRMIKRTVLLAATIVCGCLMKVGSVRAGTITVRADASGDYPTIQAAIDAANPGDEVVAEAGTYTGASNRNLNFLGKVITVRSLEPDSNICMRETVIDAEGKGVIVRFVNDEGPESVFAGFTLVAGDTSVPVRGIAGLFEFSDNARPTTRRLRIEGDLGSSGSFATPHVSQTGPLVSGPPYGGRLWNGNNPFHQPAATTHYYGSGDVDNDGNFASLDVSWAQEMADGLRPASLTADVDGNGLIDHQDIQLISHAVSGGKLPAWWNNLTNKQQRDEWVTRLMAIDRTDEHPYQNGWFVCLHFAVQTHVHSAFYRGDLRKTPYDGGQTVFNVPMYAVSVTGPAFGHSVNGILVGDDPLDFHDWRFLEPQTDNDIYPGGWNMPYGSSVRVHNPHTIGSGGSYSSDDDKVKFLVDETGWTVQDYSPNLLLTRPTPTAPLPDNRPDMWNPRVVSAGQGMMLFDCSRDGMTLTTDIHLADLPLVDPPARAPLVLSSQYSRLLDVCKGPDGTIHLLWKGKADHIPGVFYGSFDPIDRRLTVIARVSSGKREVRMGRVIAGSDRNVHVFWLEHKLNSIDHYETGIYWTRATAQGWQPEQNLAPHTDHLLDFSDWDRRDLLRYYFDVDLAANGDVILVWAEPIGQTDDSELRQRRFHGTWGPSTLIAQTNALGVELARDSAGTFHLAYWRGSRYVGRGSLLHRKSADGNAWSPPVIVEASPNASCPRMAAGAEGQLYLVWERKVDNHVVPVCRKYENGLHTEQELKVRPGADAWYPRADVLADGGVWVTWSSRCSDRVTIGRKKIHPPFDGFDEDWDVDMADYAIFASAWLTEPGDRRWNPHCDISDRTDGIINELDLAVFSENWLNGAPYYFTLDANPGWSTEGEWAFGQPTGCGGEHNGYPDPTCGYTGKNVYGVNLDGDYSIEVEGKYCLTAGPFDFSDTDNVKLRFARWLNTDYCLLARAKIEASNNGVSWFSIWENGSAVTDDGWQMVEYDIGNVADNQRTVYIRWSYEIKYLDYVQPYSGWNIDDIQVGRFP